ncbi:phytoene/squalene synthase family protein [Alicyclobacillus vulcanalis]|uniref:Phytoene synthase n=1 Tax=Alicyclobacillus vulcanalis TaxID=252246 RepID=A0A1N7LI84_9BACL|nr:phytoene/squalene synthase family protein [Alicyclobacillus vulcanalis]SIS73509.1 phytoene synthase [Alicyclobacillus vulcanalis]
MEDQVMRFIADRARRAAQEAPPMRARPFDPPHKRDEDRQLIRQHSKTFSLAARWLPARSRAAVEALYAFCRTADDAADLPEAGSRRRLEDYLAAIRGTSRSSDPVITRWLALCDGMGMPRTWSAELVETLLTDFEMTQCETLEELLAYSYGVASTVGLMTTFIVGFRPTSLAEDVFARAIALGLAMQITNILRDVAEDLARGRVYLPLEDMRRYGVTADDLSQKRLHPGWQRLCARYIQLARDLYAFALPGIRQLTPAARWPIALAAVWYRGILQDIERHRGDVFTRRAHVPLAEKVVIALCQGVPAAMGWHRSPSAAPFAMVDRHD